MNQRERGREIEVVGSKAREVELSPLTLDMVLQDLLFALLDFSLAMVCSLPIFGFCGILWHSLYVLVCNLLFDLTGGYI